MSIAQVAAQCFAFCYMVEQDLLELSFRIFQQGFDGTFWQSLEGIIGGCKECQHTFTLEGSVELGGIDCCLENGVIGTVADDVVDGVGRWQQDGIDHMHHAIVGYQVGDGYFGVVDVNMSILDGDFHRFTL